MKIPKSNPQGLRVYYDGQCVVCDKEMAVYRKKDRDKRITFVDISSPNFDAKAEGLDPARVQKVFHVKDGKNNILTGVDGFVAIWDLLNVFKPLSAMAKFPLLRPFFDGGYFAFTKIRPFLPRQECKDGNCRL